MTHLLPIVVASVQLKGIVNLLFVLKKEGKTLKTIDPLIRKKGDNGTFSAMRTLVERDKAQTETC
ncbi:hypothetical protein ACUC2M_19800 [Bacillus cytotoxicus]